MKVGVRQMSGVKKEFTLLDRVRQASQLPAGMTIKHPINGLMHLTQKKAQQLIDEGYTNAQLSRLKKRYFVDQYANS